MDLRMCWLSLGVVEVVDVRVVEVVLVVYYF